LLLFIPAAETAHLTTIAAIRIFPHNLLQNEPFFLRGPLYPQQQATTTKKISRPQGQTRRAIDTKSVF
jgi:hypothetical protein